MARVTESERDETIAELRKLIKPGDTVYTVLRHVSSSGMSRVIDLFVVRPVYDSIYPMKPEAVQEFAGERDYSAKPKRKLRHHAPQRIFHLVARAVGYEFDRDRMGIRSSGFGMDMGFEAVYNLGRTLWPRGVRKGYDGQPQWDGGYALEHKWF